MRVAQPDLVVLHSVEHHQLRQGEKHGHQPAASHVEPQHKHFSVLFYQSHPLHWLVILFIDKVLTELELYR